MWMSSRREESQQAPPIRTYSCIRTLNRRPSNERLHVFPVKVANEEGNKIAHFFHTIADVSRRHTVSCGWGRAISSEICWENCCSRNRAYGLIIWSNFILMVVFQSDMGIIGLLTVWWDYPPTTVSLPSSSQSRWVSVGWVVSFQRTLLQFEWWAQLDHYYQCNIWEVWCSRNATFGPAIIPIEKRITW